MLAVSVFGLSGCGANYEAARKEAEKQFPAEALQKRDTMNARIKEMYRQSGGDYSKISPEDRQALLEWTLNNERNAMRAFNEIGGGKDLSAADAAR